MEKTITLTDNHLSITLDELPRQSFYVLVQWPYLTELMQYEWFSTECLPYQPDGEPPSPLAALVPVERFTETLQPGVSALRI